jgi:uncharacterized lipoprotein YajG
MNPSKILSPATHVRCDRGGAVTALVVAAALLVVTGCASRSARNRVIPAAPVAVEEA